MGWNWFSTGWLTSFLLALGILFWSGCGLENPVISPESSSEPSWDGDLAADVPTDRTVTPHGMDEASMAPLLGGLMEDTLEVVDEVVDEVEGVVDTVEDSPPSIATPGTYTVASQAIATIRKAVEEEAGGLTLLDPVLDAVTTPNQGVWQGAGLINVEQGGHISPLIPGATRPLVFDIPPRALDESKVITMTVYLKMSQVDLQIVFEPSGTVFTPYATLRIPFQFLMQHNITTLQITVESGEEIEDITYDIDWDKQCLLAYVPHFSRYYFQRR